MKGGEDVVEEVFYIRAEMVEIALRGTGQIGATLYSVAADSEAVVEEVGGEPKGSALNHMQRTKMMCEIGLRFRLPFSKMLGGG